MEWIWSVLGVALIAVGLHEIFHTLLHPTGRGRLTHVVTRATWRASSGLGRRGRTVAGPLATVAVVLLWVLIQLVGWALVYLPQIPEGFSYGAGIRPDETPDLVEALTFSAVSMSTLGLGDVYPIDPVLRAVSPLQALIGFAILTAAVSWFIELYPALGRRRALALRISLLRRAETARSLPRMDPSAAVALLDELAAQLAQCRVDLSQNAESYYFTEDDPDIALATRLPAALELARAAQSCPEPSLVLSGRVLELAVDDFARTLRGLFLRRGDGTGDVLAEYGRHQRAPEAPGMGD